MADPDHEAGTGGEHLGPRQIAGRAVRGGTWTAVQVAVLLPLGIASSVVVARVLGPVDLGRLAVLTTFVGVIGPLVGLGYGEALLQYGTAAATRGRWDEVRVLLRRGVGFALLWQVPANSLAAWVILRAENPGYLGVFVVVSVLGVFGGTAMLRLIVENRTAASAKINLLTGVASNLAVIATALATASAPAVWTARLVVGLLPGLVAYALLGSQDRRALLLPARPLDMPTGFWRFALAAWGAAVAGTLVSSRVEVFVLDFNGETVAVGLFALAYGIAGQITGPINSLLSPLAPATAALVTSSEQAVRAAMRRSCALFGLGASITAGSAPGLLALVPRIYGPEYTDSRWLATPLVLALALQTTLAPYGALAYARRRRRAIPAAQWLAVTIDIGLTVALVPSLGAWGAVIGATSALALVNVFIAWPEERSVAGIGRALLRSFWLEGLLGFAVGTAIVIASSGSLAGAIVAAFVGPLFVVFVTRATGGARLIDLTTFLSRHSPPVVDKSLRVILGPTKEFR